MSKKICVCSVCVDYYQTLYDSKRHSNKSDDNIFLSENMYIVWYGAFKKYFQEVSNDTQSFWSLVPDSNNSKKISQFQETAKIRFVCQDCGNIWTSMQGLVELWVYKECHQYVLSYRLFGQKCLQCRSGDFQPANWYVEEVEKVMYNVSVTILRKKDEYGRREKRQGNPQGSHVSEGCEACQRLLCARSRDRNESGTTLEMCSSYESEDDDEKPSRKEEEEKRMTVTSDYESQDESYSATLRRSISVPEPRAERNSQLIVSNEC